MYAIQKIDKDLFIDMLHLLEKCNKFSIVEMPVTCNLIQEIRPQLNLESDKFPLEENYPLTPLREELSDFLIHCYRTVKWAGTQRKVSQLEEMPVLHSYKCCASSVSCLRCYNDFFQIGNNVDISFYLNQHCVLYTTTHEGICAIDPDYFKELIIQHKIKTLYEIKNSLD